MKIRLPIWIAAAIVAAGAAASAAPALVAMAPSSMHWIAGTGINKGTSMAVLSGDPTKSGPSVIRVNMNDGYVNQPHYHANPEYITVMQGTVMFGLGDKVDKAKAKAYPAGSFILVPANVHHWSFVKGQTIEQIGGNGPLDNLPIKHGSM